LSGDGHQFCFENNSVAVPARAWFHLVAEAATNTVQRGCQPA